MKYKELKDEIKRLNKVVSVKDKIICNQNKIIEDMKDRSAGFEYAEPKQEWENRFHEANEMQNKWEDK